MAGSDPTAPGVTKRRRGRPSRASLLSQSNAGTESVSSFRTTRDTSPDNDLDFDTPATSKMPSPDSESPKFATKIEVQLPSRRAKSNFQGKSQGLGMDARADLLDSDDDENTSDMSRSAALARRLQAEEYAKLDSDVSTDAKGKKRLRAASTTSEANVQPKRKRRRPRMVGGKEIDLDDMTAEEHSAYLQEGNAGEHLSDIYSDSTLTDDLLAQLSSDDEPLATLRKAVKKKQVAPKTSRAASRAIKTSRQNGASSGSRATRANPPEDDDSLNGDLLDTEAEAEVDDIYSEMDTGASSDGDAPNEMENIGAQRRAYRQSHNTKREKKERNRLETHHPEIKTMWDVLEAMPVIKAGKAPQPQTISRQLKPFQLEGLAWMTAMEQTEWKGGLLGDEMGLGKTIQAVSLIMSDYPAKQPSLVLVPPVALMQWQSEIKSYTDGTLKTFVYHGTNQKTKGITVKDLKKFDVIMMSYNSLESMYRKQEKGFKRKDGLHLEQSVIHAIHFHRIILDEAHSIKTRSSMTAKACFALKTDYRWCLSGTPLQNRIGEFFSLIRFLNVRPFAQYLCKQCPCATLEWTMNEDSRCNHCNHAGMQHVSVFNQELLNPIQKHGNFGPGKEAFRKLRLMTDRIMLRRLKKDHTNAMELPVKEIYVDRQFFGEEENDFANSIMTSGQRKFDTYVAQGVLLNNYANVFGLIMQMRQIADHPDLILKKNAEGGQNVLVCCICDEPSEDTIRSRCKHDFCRACVGSYVRSTDEPDCPRCHIPLSIDLEQPEIEQDETLMKKSSIINRIKMENWTSSSKIELLVHELHKLRSDNASHKSIIFSQFTTMLQLIEWRLRRAGITTVMLDGSMTPAQRQASIEHFMTNVDTECFLVSLKAGGVALNLTEASRVFIVDP